MTRKIRIMVAALLMAVLTLIGAAAPTAALAGPAPVDPHCSDCGQS